MWRPGFVFYSNSYFPSDLPQAPRPAGPAGYMICITDFVKDTDETGPSDFNFEIENPSNFDFNIERCDTHTTFQKFQNRNLPTFDFEEIPKSKSANFPIENCTHFDWGKSERRVGSHPHDFDGLLKFRNVSSDVLEGRVPSGITISQDADGPSHSILFARRRGGRDPWIWNI